MSRFRSTFLLAAFLLLVSAAPGHALINGFEGGDGNQACAAGTDWACVPAGLAVDADVDGTGASDVVFSGGKEDEPASWTFGTGSTGDKTDVRAVWSVPAETATDAYLYLAFARERGEGNAFFSFELNQVRKNWTNPQGASVPCRTDGDVLVSYEIPSTTSDPVTIKLYRWDGSGASAACPDGGTGTWTGGASPAGAHESAINQATIANGLSGAPASLADATFGEAALDLDKVVTQVGIAKPCEYFTRLQAHSRSSVSLSSSMGDFVDGGAISVAACADPDPGPDTTPPAAPTLAGDAGCNTDGAVTLSGVAEPGAQVEVREILSGNQPSRGVVDADPVTGAWTLDLAGVADGAHEYRAQARDAANNTSVDSSAVIVTVDTTAPAAPVIDAPAAGATVPVGPVELRGTAQPGTTVTVREGDTVLGAVTASASGAWSLTVVAASGAHAYDVTAADACAASAAKRVTITAGASGGGNPDPENEGEGGGLDGSPVAPVTPGTQKPKDRIQVLPALVSCSKRPFTLRLPGRGIKRVSFRIDGREVLLTTRKDRQGRFALRIDPRTFKAGRHKTSARITPTSGKARTVPMRTFSSCVVGKCVSRRAFTVRVKKVKGDRVVSAKVYVGKKRVKVIRGRRLTAQIKLTGRRKGKFNVKIVSQLASGLTSVDERTYRTCTKRKK